MSTRRSPAICCSRPIGRNSVVPMPKAPTASAYSAGGVRGEALAMLVPCGLRGSAQARRLHFQQEGRRWRISFNKSLKMTDRLDDVSLFLRVLDQGSISAAARSLDLSVAVASQRLKRLERDLGVRLLHRTTRRLHPTPEGLQLARQGR